MNVINQNISDKTQIVDRYVALVLDRVQELIQSMSENNKKHLYERFENLALQPCPNREEQSIADVIAGKTYSQDEKKELALLNLMNSFAQRAKLLQDTISTTQVAELLSCRSRQTPLDRREKKTLLAVKDNGQWQYPLWQFDPEGNDGVINGLPETIQALKVSDLAKVSWLTSPNRIFDNLTPLEMLKQGEIKRVVREALGVGLTQ
jgi:hypothetical protein